MAAPKKSRKSPRAQVALVARYRSPTAFEFVQEECFDLSLGGMFIRSPAPAPAGTLIKLECDVNGSSGKIRGVARVVWLREHSSDHQPAGMGVKFVKLDPGARETIAEVLEQLGLDRDDRDTARPPAPTSSIPAAARAPTSSRPASSGTSGPPREATSGTRAGASNPASADTRPTPSSPAATSVPSASAPPSQESARAEAGAAAIAEAAAKRPSPRPAPAAASIAGELPEKITPVEMRVPAAVAANISASATKAERANMRLSPAPRGPRNAGSGDRHSATEPPAGAGSHSFVYGALALAGAVTLFIVFSSQQSRGPSTSAPPPTPVAASQIAAPIAAQAPEPTTPTEAAEARVNYVVDIATTPSGARVTAGGHTLVAPGQLDLGQLDEPVQLTAESDGFEPAVATVDRVGFMREDGAMRRRIELTLTERAQATEPAVAAAPTPAPAPVIAERAKPKPTPAPPAVPAALHSHHSRERAPTPEPEAQAQAPAEVAVSPSRILGATPIDPPAKIPEPRAAPAPVATPAPVAATPVVTVTPAPVQAVQEAPQATPLQTATACLTKGDNACVIRALEGKAKTARELELLIETYRATGDTSKAEASMRVYVANYPTERRAANYRGVLERQ